MNYFLKNPLSIGILFLFVLVFLSCQKSDGDSDLLGKWEGVNEETGVQYQFEFLPDGATPDPNMIWFRRDDLIVLVKFSDEPHVFPGSDSVYYNLLWYMLEMQEGVLRLYDYVSYYNYEPISWGRRTVICSLRQVSKSKMKESTREESNKLLLGRWETKNIIAGLGGYPAGSIVYGYMEFHPDGKFVYGQYSSLDGFAKYEHSDWIWMKRGDKIMCVTSSPVNQGSNGYMYKGCFKVLTDGLFEAKNYSGEYLSGPSGSNTYRRVQSY